MKQVFFIIFYLISTQIISQISNQTYRVESPFQANEFLNTECQSDIIKVVCKNATIKVISATTHTVTIKILRGKSCENAAEPDKTYCVREEVFTIPGSVILITNNWTGDLGGGILTIPFKFDNETFKVFPSGEIGGVGGLRFSKNSTDIMIGLILGLSSIPLNDLNSPNTNEIKTVAGITYGTGVSIKITQGFQFGIYYGNDLYNTDNQKYSKDWFSFGFGYDFLRFSGTKKAKNNSQILAPF